MTRCRKNSTLNSDNVQEIMDKAQAVNGGQLPQGAGNTDDAFAGDWQQAVLNWIEGGASCN